MVVSLSFFFGDNEGGDCVVSSMMIYNVGVGGGGGGEFSNFKLWWTPSNWLSEIISHV